MAGRRGRRGRQPGLIRAPPWAALRFEVSRCRPLGRRPVPAAGPSAGLAAELAARVYPGAGWGLGAGSSFLRAHLGLQSHKGSKQPVGAGLPRCRSLRGLVRGPGPHQRSIERLLCAPRLRIHDRPAHCYFRSRGAIIPVLQVRS